MSIVKSLNKSQRLAIKTLEGPLRIIAGPGSGKTRTLIARVAKIIDSGHDPRSILAVTFTNKAAHEMENRVREYIGKLKEKPFISTYHSFCAKLLRKHFDKLPNDTFSRKFIIMDGSDQKTILNKIYKELKISPLVIPFEASIRYISQCKMNDVSTDQAYDEAKGNVANQKAEIYEDYLLHQQKNNSMDFDDLIVNAVWVLKNNKKVRDDYSNRFKYIHVDEFQDSNRKQYELIKLLASSHNNIFVVGDPDQIIYSWRGTDINIIFDFEKDFKKCKTIFLNQNYRSSKNIVNLASKFIEKNRIRFNRSLSTSNKKGEKIHVYGGFDEYQEAEWIAQTIKNKIESGAKPSDFKVLYRSSFVSIAIEKALLEKDIKFQVIGGIKFLERLEIKTALSYLKFSAQYDDASFIKIISSPKRGIGEAKILHLKKLAKIHKTTFWDIINNYQKECLFSSNQLEEIKKFIDLFSSSPSEQDKNFFRGFEELLKTSGYLLALKKDSKNLARYDNVIELIHSIENECKKNIELTVGKYLSDVALEWIRVDENTPSVQVMTIHAAKGLEAEHVFVMGLSESIFPSDRITCEEEMEEERRILYVAITRAKKELYLTYSHQKRPSQFFRYLNSKFLENSQWNSNKYSIGQKVLHNIFGLGTIVALSEELLEIDFGKKKGIKTLMANHKALKKA